MLYLDYKYVPYMTYKQIFQNSHCGQQYVLLSTVLTSKLSLYKEPLTLTVLIAIFKRHKIL